MHDSSKSLWNRPIRIWPALSSVLVCLALVVAFAAPLWMYFEPSIEYMREVCVHSGKVRTRTYLSYRFGPFARGPRSIDLHVTQGRDTPLSRFLAGCGGLGPEDQEWIGVWELSHPIRFFVRHGAEYQVPTPGEEHRHWACKWLPRLVFHARTDWERLLGRTLCSGLRGAVLDGQRFDWGSMREYIESEFVETEDGLRPRSAADHGQSSAKREQAKD